MKIINISTITLFSIMLLSLMACRKFVDIDGPKNQVTTGLVFSDSTKANAALAGIYYQIASAGNFGLFSGGMTIYTGLSSDELTYTATDATIAAFYNNNILPVNDRITQLYYLGYKYVYAANACIEGIAASPGISQVAKDQMIAEARFLRAFSYFNLLNLYGAVPLVTITDHNATRLTGRSDPATVYNQIIDDLRFAQQYLPKDPVIRDRASYHAATFLLAKVLLFTGRHQEAIAEADKVISSGKFTLESNLNNVFLAASTETIWNTLSVIPAQATYDGLNFIPTTSTARPRYVLTSGLYSAFEGGDNRRTSWVKVNTNAGTPYPYPFKYKIRSTTGTAGENYVVMRLAELYLIRAEAKVSINDNDGGRNDLNVVRKRAGLGNTPVTERPGLLTAIENERKVELFCEWANRWFDLKRTGRAITVLGSLKPNINSNSLLYPIPVRELNANPNLSQNPGY